jgi:hypothetical protein
LALVNDLNSRESKRKNDEHHYLQIVTKMAALHFDEFREVTRYDHVHYRIHPVELIGNDQQERYDPFHKHIDGLFLAAPVVKMREENSPRNQRRHYQSAFAS